MRYRWFDEDRTREERVARLREAEVREEPAATEKRRLFRGELFGSLLAVAAILYGAFTEDLPIIYLAMAFLVYELRAFTVLLGGRVGPFLGNLLWGFSVALFLGAIFMAFF